MFQLFFPFGVFLEKVSDKFVKKLHHCLPAVYSYGILLKVSAAFFKCLDNFCRRINPIISSICRYGTLLICFQPVAAYASSLKPRDATYRRYFNCGNSREQLIPL